MDRFITIRSGHIECVADMTEMVLISSVLAGQGSEVRGVFLLRNGSEIEFGEGYLLLDERGKEVSLQEVIALWRDARRGSLTSASIADVAGMLSESLEDNSEG